MAEDSAHSGKAAFCVLWPGYLIVMVEVEVVFMERSSRGRLTKQRQKTLKRCFKKLYSHIFTTTLLFLQVFFEKNNEVSCPMFSFSGSGFFYSSSLSAKE